MKKKTSFNKRNSPLSGEVPQAEVSSHILVIRLSAMGDVAMTVPVLRVLTATYPHLKVSVLTRGFFKPMFKDIPRVSVYEADVNGIHSGVIGLCRLAKDLRDMGIDKVADLHDVLRSNVLKSVFYMFGIPVKQIDKGRSEKKALTRENNKIFKQLKPTVQRYADVFDALGYPVDLNTHQFPEKEKISEKIRILVGTEPKKWLGIAPFAQHDSKAYPAVLMEEVLGKLNENPKIKVLLFGGGNKEKQQLETWAARFKNTLSIAGKLTLAEELALISNLDAMLSMDSGNGHMAAMYGIPVISIWGVTHPYAGFRPFNQPQEYSLLPDLNKYPKIPTSVYGNKFPEAYENVISSIPPKSVSRKIEEVLF
ncbi:glycosyltransferase family 9 protein [Salegentibacter salegens]|uniref:ADP-heptose:LPS heptosyltransferase n=1 Tax=Salegentibacter salegens TaxID=143223 RepID=A0A1M7MAJ5_9FLAO|nr:glycosyltransferase family 9 protein [Salegentibacter salegens]PRX51561.1 ADP-heptose:LPS heptosyltransferase [Salegentibacter salegens]SHM87307.1 ADP-heptose:LPS heptosyltransferase [Salegentibacter salegens]